MHEHTEHPPVPGFLRCADLRLWLSDAGQWFLYAPALQAGGVWLPPNAQHGGRWQITAPMDVQEWAAHTSWLDTSVTALRAEALAAVPPASNLPS